jgi:hypothetical protein
MKLMEMFIDENDTRLGVEAVSVVENPAIESNFVALKNQQFIELAEVNKEKKELLGAALIPEKPILRIDDDGGEYYIYFSKETIRKARELFAKRKYNDQATLEHAKPIEGMTVVESWIVEDKQKDKSALYGLDVPVGTWVISMKADNDEVYQLAKDGKVKGFSIEGFFSDKNEKPKTEVEATLEMLREIEREIGLADSYSDYPEGAKNNAKRALEFADKNGWGSCGTAVGKQRANQLAKGEPISRDTIARMASFARHEQNKDVPYTEGCGGLMWDAWGGSAGINWAKSKLDEIEGK